MLLIDKIDLDFLLNEVIVTRFFIFRKHFFIYLNQYYLSLNPSLKASPTLSSTL